MGAAAARDGRGRPLADPAPRRRAPRFVPASWASRVGALRLPIFTWLGTYQRGWLRGDLVAGLTVWAVLVPESLAYATIAGVSPVVGLYAAPPALILYAAFGSSRHLVVGPMSATAALSAAAVGDLVAPGRRRRSLRSRPLRWRSSPGRRARRRAAAARLPRQLHLRAGAQGLHRRPRADDHHRPGAEAVRGRQGRGRLLRAALGRPRATSATRAAARSSSALASLAVVLGLRRFAPVVPGSLVAVLARRSPPSTLFDLDDHGVEIVGHIDSGLPSFGLPDVAAHRLPRRRRVGASA